eukprot:1828564-Rhodomonas_salina.1
MPHRAQRPYTAHTRTAMRDTHHAPFRARPHTAAATAAHASGWGAPALGVCNTCFRTALASTAALDDENGDALSELVTNKFTHGSHGPRRVIPTGKLQQESLLSNVRGVVDYDVPITNSQHT